MDSRSPSSDPAYDFKVHGEKQQINSLFDHLSVTVKDTIFHKYGLLEL